MAVAKRTGPDFLFIANANSQKFDDIKKNKVANVYFHDSGNQDWISITGEAVTSSNDDPRIKEIYSKGVSAWFGDLGDGVHTGGPEDPRMKLIEVQAKCKSACSWRSVLRVLMMSTQTSHIGSTELAPSALRRKWELRRRPAASRPLAL